MQAAGLPLRETQTGGGGMWGALPKRLGGGRDEIPACLCRNDRKLGIRRELESLENGGPRAWQEMV